MSTSIDSTCYDFIIRNGTVMDGSGRAGFSADVALQGDRIAKIGGLEADRGRQEIDAAGLVVAPGFIDVHTHDDAVLITQPAMTAKLSQGVTTVIGGNCGVSAAPYSRAGDPPGMLRLIFKSRELVAPTFRQYLERVANAGPSVNAAFLTGHTTLRMQVMGSDLERIASADESAAMRDLLTQCLEEGSLGLSTGLYYAPARRASTQEVIEIARPLVRHAGVYTTHLRDEGDQVMESLGEALDIGRAVEAPVIVSHHKCMGRRNFGKSVQTLALLDAASKVQEVAFDVYPYTAGSTVLTAETAAQSDRTLISWSEPYPEFCGKDLQEVARALGCSREQAIQKLQPAGAIYFLMDESDVTRIIANPGAMIGSDGLPDDPHPHPRLWGTFPRILGRYVRDLNVLTLPEAVHRMTGLSAQRFGIRNRGRIEVRQYADVTVFDPQTVSDAATFEHPTRAAAGIRHVFVNGQLAWNGGSPTAGRSGKVLRRPDLTD
jgi:N-acyl-D-amino-acid deacylase